MQRRREGSRDASHGSRKPTCTALFAGQDLQSSQGSCPLLWLRVSTALWGRNDSHLKPRGRRDLDPDQSARQLAVLLWAPDSVIYGQVVPCPRTQKMCDTKHPLGSPSSAPSLPPAPLFCSLGEYAHSSPIRGGQELPARQSTVRFNSLRHV